MIGRADSETSEISETSVNTVDAQHHVGTSAGDRLSCDVAWDCVAVDDAVDTQHHVGTSAGDRLSCDVAWVYVTAGAILLNVW